MVALPQERRHDRYWVADFFASQDLSLQEAGGNSRYWINYHALRRVPLRPLDEVLLSEVVRPEYVRWANRNVGWRGLWSEGLEYTKGVRGLRRATQWARTQGLANKRTEAYYAYLTLWPIESLLRRRDQARDARCRGASTAPGGTPKRLEGAAEPSKSSSPAPSSPGLLLNDRRACLGVDGMDPTVRPDRATT